MQKIEHMAEETQDFVQDFTHYWQLPLYFNPVISSQECEAPGKLTPVIIFITVKHLETMRTCALHRTSKLYMNYYS